MALSNILHMNMGDGESSYANNSFLQETATRKAVPFLEHAIKAMANEDVFNGCYVIADLGCASGTNTLMIASIIIDMIRDVCQENNRKTPQIQVCLNDLFGNDFNNIFKKLPNFYSNLKKEKGDFFGRCFVSAVPGSFYGRLFPDKSLHLVHSSYSLQWLSQVPEGIENNSLNIYMAKRSPPNVFQAYGKQFQTDFTNFLQMRSKEIVRGGSMVLTFLGRSSVDPTCDDCCCLWELLAQSLLDMVKEGLIRELDINSFNLPIYTPCEDEVRNIIQNEGSFSLDNMNVFEINWDPHDTDYTNISDFDHELSHQHGENAAKVLRAVFEPLLRSHFGSPIIDHMVFDNYGKCIAENLANKKTRHFNIAISLTKK